jgi:hypothetical protein
MSQPVHRHTRTRSAPRMRLEEELGQVGVATRSAAWGGELSLVRRRRDWARNVIPGGSVVGRERP